MLALNQVFAKSKAAKCHLPALIELFHNQQRFASAYEHSLTYGQGGRNSFNGIVATVFGATGFIGKYVVNRLARTGTQIIVPYRGIDEDIRHVRLMGDLGQIVFQEYNIRDYESILKATAHSNVVINLTGRNYATRQFTMEDILVTGAQALAAASKENNVKNFIHVSALGANAGSPSYYLRAKARSERVVTDVLPRATIMRPASVYGDEDRYFNKYAYMRSLPVVPLVKGGWETTKRPVFVGDVAQAIVTAAQDPSSIGKTIELYGPEEYYLRHIVEYIYRLVRKPCRVVSIPPRINSFIGYLGEFSPFDKRITRDMAARDFLSEDVSPDAFTFEDLGITASNMNDEALSCLRRHRDYNNHSKIMLEEEFCKPVSDYQ